jgi:hypothetical protein
MGHAGYFGALTHCSEPCSKGKKTFSKLVPHMARPLGKITEKDMKAPSPAMVGRKESGSLVLEILQYGY